MIGDTYQHYLEEFIDRGDACAGNVLMLMAVVAYANDVIIDGFIDVFPGHLARQQLCNGFSNLSAESFFFHLRVFNRKPWLQNPTHCGSETAPNGPLEYAGQKGAGWPIYRYVA